MKDNTKFSPPKWADRFLEWYCNPDLLEQIQGDVHELYYWRMAEQSPMKAKKAFIWDIIRFFRWRNIKKTTTQKQHNNTMGMFKNYLKIGWRNILNQKVPSIINIFGLSCAIACCLVAYLFIEGVRLKGMYQKNKDEIYMLTHARKSNEKTQRYGYASAPLSDLIENEFPFIERIVRVHENSGIVKHKNQAFSERIFYVDPDFMDMFTYPIIYGSKASLREPNEVLITKRTANKLFGTTHPIGKEIDLIINGELQTMVVGGVMETLPSTAMLRFDVLVNYSYYDEASSNYSLNEKWGQQPWQFIQMSDKNKLTDMAVGFDKLVKLQNEIRPDQKYLELQLEPFNTLVKNAMEIQGGVGQYGGLAPQILLSSIAIFMLILAVFNYINIAISMATKRIKEIGVRKVIGARKSQLILQFLSENFITCFLAIILGGVIASTMLIPWFNDIASKNFRLDLLHNYHLWTFFGILLVFITVVSGSYPAFYISSFKPVTIFRGIQTIGSRRKFTGVLLSFQFILAMITIIAGCAFVRTNNKNENRGWGYNNEDKIVVNIPSDKDYIALKNILLSQPNVVEIAGSRQHIGEYVNYRTINYNNENLEVAVINGADNYPKVMGLRLVEGQLFNTNLKSEVSTSIVVNQTFMDRLELKFPTEELITFDSVKYSIIGVVEDFHYNNFSFSIAPMIIRAIPHSGFNYMTVEVEPGTAKKMSPIIKVLWHDQVNNELYHGKEQTTIFDKYFNEIAGVSHVLLFTATLAVILSAIGLFGLISLNMSSRIKDIGIRKILGANMSHLSITIYKRFLVLWIIGCFMGGTLGTLASSALLDMIYAYHPETGITPLVIAVCVLIIVMVSTISSQLVKVKNTNLVDTLKME